MSTGTNQERLEQNNLLLEDIKEQIHNLPDFVISQEDYDTIESQADDLLGGSPAPIYSSKPNVFVQLTEPSTKDGIWIETNDYEMSGVICDNDIFENETWNTTKMVNTSPIPNSFNNGSAVSIGTNIYLFGVNTGSDWKAAYKYDTLTDTYTKLTNIPYSFSGGGTAFINTDIYLFGGTGSYKATYKYDTLTDTYTKLTDIPYNFTSAHNRVISVGTDIYLYGAGSSNRVHRYNTLTNTYAQITNAPYDNPASITSIGTDIYLFSGTSGSSNTQKAYKYDTLTNTYTQLTNIPYGAYACSVVVVENDIYILGGGDNKNKTYKYDTLTNTYTQLTNIPYQFIGGGVVVVGDDREIYLLGGTSYSTKIQIFELNSADYEDNQVVISQGVAKYHTKLLTNGNNAEYWFNNAWIYTDEDSLVKGLPTYYGNGTSWVKFKN